MRKKKYKSKKGDLINSIRKPIPKQTRIIKPKKKKILYKLAEEEIKDGC